MAKFPTFEEKLRFVQGLNAKRIIGNFELEAIKMNRAIARVEAERDMLLDACKCVLSILRGDDYIQDCDAWILRNTIDALESAIKKCTEEKNDER